MNIVIIGATQGLGLCLTRKFLKHGHKVAAGIVERSTPAALAALQETYSGMLKVFQADVTDEPELLRGAALCRDFMGEIDSLCSVAGILLPGDRVNTIERTDIAELRRTFDVNAVGPVIVGKSFYPVMKRGGSVFIVTSEGMNIKWCGQWIPCYSLSKIAATKAVGIFNAAVKDVDFYAVHPGRMNTEMGRTSAQIEPEESADGLFRLMTGEAPVSREHWYIDYQGREMES